MKKRNIFIEGMVTEVLASSDDGGTTWDQSFFLSPWREVGGELHTDIFRASQRRVRSLGLGDKLEGKTVSVAVRNVEIITKGFKCCAGIAVDRPKSIRTRLHAIKEQKAPKNIRDEKLGVLTVEDGKLTMWRGPRGRRYELLVLSGVKLSRASTLVAKVEKSLAKLRARIATKLLTTCNRWRASDGEKPVTLAAFTRALHLASIAIGPRSTSLIFECDLLGDHGVEARIAPTGSLREVSIA